MKKVILNCYRKLSAQISTLQAEVTGINLHMAHFKSHASTSSNLTSLLSGKRKFLEDNDLSNFPITDMKKFEDFDIKLKTDQCVRKEIVSFNFILYSLSTTLFISLHITMLNIFYRRELYGLLWTSKKNYRKLLQIYS